MENCERIRQITEKLLVVKLGNGENASGNAIKLTKKYTSAPLE